jgi:hypothetical protein
MAASIPLLLSNASGIDLIDYFLHSFQSFDVMNSMNKVERTLTLDTVSELQTCTGTIVVNNSTTYTKSEQRNYSLSIVSDQTFINNLIYFINLYRATIPKVTVNYQGTVYICTSTITINSSRFYILEFPPAPVSEPVPEPAPAPSE